ncbi:glycosyltransferase family 2 protein [Enterococcus casseliflavus]|uniref:glycosyltransferase family 2 protein n=1 Tax=Enterococcus casseliflavus TaxID=37734 RepID=UPI00115E6BBB|nr:glycosyltransferase [Enterococcus casseliflavus]
MKTLSIIVPCYNSQDYMERCIDSLLVGGETVEIIIVNDGSHDQTGAIAERYQRSYPKQIKAVHQENGGHGQAINTGLEVASGTFIKIVDSDDWVDEEAYRQILTFLTSDSQANSIDMVISNYVYETQWKKNKRCIHYQRFLPENEPFGWADVRFPFSKYLLMHSVIYRKSVLEKANLQLPKRTFYVDNLYVYEPLPYVKKMVYLNVDFYRYYIGRSDQSVNEKVMISRIDQQLKVNRTMIDYYLSLDQAGKEVTRYMRRYLEAITTVSTILLIKEGSKESLLKKKDLWKLIRSRDQLLYFRLRFGLLGHGVHFPGAIGRKASLGFYHLAQKFYGFN